MIIACVAGAEHVRGGRWRIGTIAVQAGRSLPHTLLCYMQSRRGNVSWQRGDDDMGSLAPWKVRF